MRIAYITVALGSLIACGQPTPQPQPASEPVPQTAPSQQSAPRAGAAPQTTSPAETLRELRARLDEAAKLAAQAEAELGADPADPAPPGTTIAVGCNPDPRVRADELQMALNRAGEGGITVVLTAKCEYIAYGMEGKATRGFAIKGNTSGRPIRLTTAGFAPNAAEGINGLVTAAQCAQMATLRQGTGNVHVALEVWNGEGAGDVLIQGIRFTSALPAGHGEMLKIGDHGETSDDNLADGVRINQSCFEGDPKIGQKRAVAALGRNIEFTQNRCTEIWIGGQDSQCVVAWNGGKSVTIRYNYMTVGSEPIMIGGSPSASAEMSPENWIIEDNVIHHPLRWMADGRNRQIKNLFELKFVRGAQIRRNLFVNNWVAAQAGMAILLHYTTNGTCRHCPGTHDVVFEDNVVLNVHGGISLQGFAYEPDYFSTERLQNVVIRNNYVVMNGNGRPLQGGNFKGRHDIHVEHNTFINNSASMVSLSCGWAWIKPDAREPGCPMQGFEMVGNVFTRYGTYGITAPDGSHFFTGLSMMVDSDLEIRDNVFGDAPASALKTVNTLGGGNISMSRAELVAKLPTDSCVEIADDKEAAERSLVHRPGAECDRLTSVFAMRKFIPEP
jgi:hypothetical protein